MPRLRLCLCLCLSCRHLRRCLRLHQHLCRHLQFLMIDLRCCSASAASLLAPKANIEWQGERETMGGGGGSEQSQHEMFRTRNLAVIELVRLWKLKLKLKLQLSWAGHSTLHDSTTDIWSHRPKDNLARLQLIAQHICEFTIYFQLTLSFFWCRLFVALCYYGVWWSFC